MHQIVPPTAINTVDFSYSTSGGSTVSKWVGKESQWESKGPITQTTSGSTTTTTGTVYSIKVSTVKDTGTITGIAPSDLYIEIPPEVKEIIFKHATAVCGGSAKKRGWLERRQSPCAAASSPQSWARAVENYANRVADDPAVNELLTNPFENVPTFTANDIQRAVAALKQSGGAIASKILRNKVAVFTVFLGLFVAYGDVPLQAKVEKASMNPTMTYPSTTPPVTTSSSTSSGCKATGTIPPACEDVPNCNGKASPTCQSGKYKHCPCAGQAKGTYHTVSVKEYMDGYNAAQSAIGAINNAFEKAVPAHWCEHQCDQGTKPSCVCACGGQTYSEKAKTTEYAFAPSPSPTNAAEIFWWQPCPWISGDPNLSKITVSKPPTPVQTTISVGSWPHQSPASSSHAVPSPSATQYAKSFNRDTATKAIKARCKQLASEAATNKPSESWPPAVCAVPNTGAHWDAPAGAGGCDSARGQSDIEFKMTINYDNEECTDAGYKYLKFDEATCVKAFQATVDSFPDYDDMSKKYGGIFYDSSCWRYSLTPWYHCEGYAKPCKEVEGLWCEKGWGDACK
ncbi:MAG: hypothetical protein Q9160_006011 [Pyrenula sp. 1 TL-2023]